MQGWGQLTDAWWPCEQAAVQQYLDFTLGIYADPLFFGNFPASVQAANFPGLTLSTDEQAMLAGSVDYFALNHCESCIPMLLNVT